MHLLLERVISPPENNAKERRLVLVVVAGVDKS
jgi:hypothetical protein